MCKMKEMFFVSCVNERNVFLMMWIIGNTIYNVNIKIFFKKNLFWKSCDIMVSSQLDNLTF